MGPKSLQLFGIMIEDDRGQWWKCLCIAGQCAGLAALRACAGPAPPRGERRLRIGRALCVRLQQRFRLGQGGAKKFTVLRTLAGKSRQFLFPLFLQRLRKRSGPVVRRARKLASALQLPPYLCLINHRDAKEMHQIREADFHVPLFCIRL
ncbi:protein of unknown function [Methylocella tundrae]|uniref:Uncharacterized protein n=1 Tax=Methylocella tundrae TaxID=227605 RepID=A0A4U8Z0X0_METTU|nr:protein of unknown function [Methylocella tundrae]